MPSLAEPKVVRKVRLKLRRHGLRATLFSYAMRAINSVTPFRILRGVYLQRAKPSFATCPAGYTAGFVSRDLLREFAENPRNELSPKFVDKALSRGDHCFAICHGATLAAYGWYSFRPTPTDLSGVVLHFSPDWVYRYKGFTQPRYRGQRLHAFGMTLALQHYLARGFRGSLSYVEATNLDSLKSCFRAGCRPFGSIYVLQGGERLYTLRSPGCDRLGFRLEPYSLSPFGSP